MTKHLLDIYMKLVVEASQRFGLGSLPTFGLLINTPNQPQRGHRNLDMMSGGSLERMWTNKP